MVSNPQAGGAPSSSTVVEDFSIPAQGLVATLETRRDRKPIRRIIAGRQTKPVGFYYSEKCGGFMPHESPHELSAFYIAETDIKIDRYRVQPHAIWLADVNGIDPTYIPDREDMLSSGQVRIVEIKKEQKFTDEYRAKLERARLHYEHNGILFEVHDQEEIRRQPRFSAAEKIQAYKRTSVTDSDLRCLRALFFSNETLAFAVARDALGGNSFGFAKLSAMIVRRLVGVDLANGISDSTAIHRIRL